MSSSNNTIYKKTSFLAGNNSEFINEFYADYIADPNSLPESWRKFFDGLSDDQKLIYDNHLNLEIARYNSFILLALFDCWSRCLQNSGAVDSLPSNLLVEHPRLLTHYILAQNVELRRQTAISDCFQ